MVENLGLMRSFWKNRRVLVTGHTGFKGVWLCSLLNKLGAEVFGYALESDTTPNLYNITGLSKQLSGEALLDIRQSSALKRFVQEIEPNVVFHLAAQPLVRLGYQFPHYTFETNVMGTVNLLDILRRSPTLRSVVVITTDKCYEDQQWDWGYRETDRLGGSDPYSASKACVELVTQSYRRSFYQEHVGLATARAGNVIGGGDFSPDRIIPDIIKHVTGQQKLIIRNPDAIRPWQHVIDPIVGYMHLAMRLYYSPTEFSQPWNFGPSTGNDMTVKALVEQFISTWDNPVYNIDDVILQSNPKKETHKLILATDKVRQALGWKPMIEGIEAIKMTASWYQSHHQGGHDNVLFSQLDELIKNVDEVYA